MVKIIKYFFLILFQLLVLIVLLLALNSILYKNPSKNSSCRPSFRKEFKSLKDSLSYLGSLDSIYSPKKILPKQFKTQAILALAYYPELEDVPIKFIERKASFPLSSYPDPLSLLIPWKERAYNIVISNRSVKEYEKILLHRLPFGAQIGVLGHELAHTAYYTDKSSIEIALLGLKYLLSYSFREKFEKETDISTINHGLGYQLLDWRTYFEGLFNAENQSISSTIYFEDRYLNAMEIREIIRQNPIYK